MVTYGWYRFVGHTGPDIFQFFAKCLEFVPLFKMQECEWLEMKATTWIDKLEKKLKCQNIELSYTL